jgi:hypothetical protein
MGTNNLCFVTCKFFNIVQRGPGSYARCQEAHLRDRSVYLGWLSCRVKDYAKVTKCYKCQRYGHVAKYCKGGLTPRQQLATCCQQHFLVMLPVAQTRLLRLYTQATNYCLQYQCNIYV